MTLEELEAKWPWIKAAAWSGCGEGWYTLLDQTCQEIAELLNFHRIPLTDFEITQYKEKYGSLRIYFTCVVNEENLALNDLVYDTICDIIDNAELESEKICEVCGEPGQLLSDGWWRTLCDKHEAERQEKMFVLTSGADNVS